jgi:predicted metalloprotease
MKYASALRAMLSTQQTNTAKYETDAFCTNFYLSLKTGTVWSYVSTDSDNTQLEDTLVSVIKHNATNAEGRSSTLFC